VAIYLGDCYINQMLDKKGKLRRRRLIATSW
jgi:hypothetical protein